MENGFVNGCKRRWERIFCHWIEPYNRTDAINVKHKLHAFKLKSFCRWWFCVLNRRNARC